MADDGPSHPQSARIGDAVKRAATGKQSVHPALVPGVSAEDSKPDYPTRLPVFITALVVAIGFIAWAAFARRISPR
ncbi:MAG: hypothetical protein L0J74_09350 [Corynebacterium sp.]|uniref:hypothetical protein n=1 Tax=Corynebacterium TaxID=1716 RepID=UPI00264A2790|nr:hypothetical protein [Corynebacterium sp.]MDN5721667.1 hypothetical protein [Corynebacterium sp.]MDN6282140.1 hypothetical protein [Corynebacterium sp.]MDN6305988.1 hypothetical protein [Corynebacterium sp.]MDN6351800.1 hypothetical protein [Corynebacterium sp.]MDN6366536.1 hypothetical protein [Corynebacterium sp.]